jgi:hypothetical protein
VTKEEYNKVYHEGILAKSILDNPYWLDYPKHEETEEAVRGRVWVDGWCWQRFTKYEMYKLVTVVEED